MNDITIDSTLGFGLNMDFYEIGELPLPTLPNSAANKNYVDTTASSSANLAESHSKSYTDDTAFTL